MVVAKFVCVQSMLEEVFTLFINRLLKVLDPLEMNILTDRISKMNSTLDMF